MKSFTGILSAVLLCGLLVACSQQQQPVQEQVIQRFAVNDLQGLISQDGVELDAAVSSDGGGALRVESQGKTVVRLFEVHDLDVEQARLLYRARLRTENLDGKAYLEMWCHFPGQGEFFSRGLERPVTGSQDWTTEEIPFFLQKGQRPDFVKLNLVVEGTGTAWIDDIKLLRSPLS